MMTLWRFPKNRGTPKTFIFVGLPLINHPAIGYPHDYGNPSVLQEEALMREAIMQAVGAMCLGAPSVSVIYSKRV
jgi:hypothetical protein